jgi:FAD/FMN-containing dehydrogenase
VACRRRVGTGRKPGCGIQCLNGVCDGGLMIDLSQMKGITIDPARRIARAETGLKLGEFDRATQEYGLVTTDPPGKYRSRGGSLRVVAEPS